MIKNTGVLVKIFVFRGNEGLLDPLGDRVIGQEKAAFTGIFGQKTSICGMDTRGNGRLVGGELGIIGQLF